MGNAASNDAPLPVSRVETECARGGTNMAHQSAVILRPTPLQPFSPRQRIVMNGKRSDQAEHKDPEDFHERCSTNNISEKERRLHTADTSQPAIESPSFKSPASGTRIAMITFSNGGTYLTAQSSRDAPT